MEDQPIRVFEAERDNVAILQSLSIDLPSIDENPKSVSPIIEIILATLCGDCGTLPRDTLVRQNQMIGVFSATDEKRGLAHRYQTTGFVRKDDFESGHSGGKLLIHCAETVSQREDCGKPLREARGEVN